MKYQVPSKYLSTKENLKILSKIIPATEDPPKVGAVAMRSTAPKSIQKVGAVAIRSIAPKSTRKVGAVAIRSIAPKSIPKVGGLQLQAASQVSQIRYEAKEEEAPCSACRVIKQSLWELLLFTVCIFN